MKKLKVIQNKWIALVFCLFLSFLIFSNTFQNDFVFDDISVIRDNQILKDIQNLPQLFTFYYRHSPSGVYRPLTMSSYTLNYFLFGSSVQGFHFINILLHAFNCWLLFLLIRRLYPKKILAYLTAFLFLILPVHTEAVTGLVGRAELLSFLFSLLTLLPLLSNFQWKILVSAFCFLAGLLSKETAAASLPIYFFIAIYQKRFKQKNFWSEILSLILVFIFYLLIRYFVLGPYFLVNNATFVENPLKFVSTSDRILTAFKILVLYLGKITIPFQLSCDYSYNQIPIVTNLTSWAVLVGLTVFIVFIYFLFLPQKIGAAFYIGSVIFICSFLPVSNLIVPIGTIMGERLVYFASAGVCLILSETFWRLSQFRPIKIFRIAVILLIGGLTVFYINKTYLRNYDWRSQRTLFFSAAQSSPKSVLSRSNKGAIYLIENNYQLAEKEIMVANQIYPNYPPAINNLGLIYRHQGDLYKAEEQFLKAIEIAGYPPSFENIGLVYLDMGNYSEAKKWLLHFLSNNQKTVNFYIQQYFEIKINQALTMGDQKSVNQWLKKAKMAMENNK